ncbi:site-specific integrase [Ligilactobacillus sp. LYQ135]
MAQFIKYKNAKNEVRYRFKVYLGLDPVTGKRIETSRQGFKTKREAKLALDAVKAEYNVNGWNAGNNNLTINDVVDDYLVSYKKKVKPQTYARNLNNYNRLFRNHFGQNKIKSVKPYDLQQLINELSDNHPASYRVYINVLRQAFNYAYRLGLIDSNIFDKVEYPPIKTNKHDFNFYSKKELKQFLAAAKKDNQYIYDVCYLLAFTGLRIGELLALTDDDIDYTHKIIKVRHTVAYDERTKETFITAPKTQSSIREVSFNNECANILSKHNGILFKYKGGYTPYWYPRTQLRNFYNKHKELKQIRIHGFRHTHASLLFEAGANIKQVQKRLGHTNVDVTLDIYTHITKDKTNEVVDLLDRYFE